LIWIHKPILDDLLTTSQRKSLNEIDCLIGHGNFLSLSLSLSRYSRPKVDKAFLKGKGETATTTTRERKDLAAATTREEEFRTNP
jgi:hypothetical protein